jgi:hypothetical protein
MEYIDEDIRIGDYKQVLGFRRQMMKSQVWLNMKTDTWGFHVTEYTFDGIPNMGEYNSFTELLESITKLYFDNWKFNY